MFIIAIALSQMLFVAGLPAKRNKSDSDESPLTNTTGRGRLGGNGDSGEEGRHGNSIGPNGSLVGGHERTPPIQNNATDKDGQKGVDVDVKEPSGISTPSNLESGSVSGHENGPSTTEANSTPRRGDSSEQHQHSSIRPNSEIDANTGTPPSSESKPSHVDTNISSLFLPTVSKPTIPTSPTTNPPTQSQPTSPGPTNSTNSGTTSSAPSQPTSPGPAVSTTSDTTPPEFPRPLSPRATGKRRGTLRQELGRFFSFNSGGNVSQVRGLLDQIKKASANAGPAMLPPKVQLQMRTVPRVVNAEDKEDETELSKNSHIVDDLFEGDIVLKVHQAKHILQQVTEGKPGQARSKRKVVRDQEDRWPTNDMYYTFDPDLDDSTKSIVLSAMQAWKDATCLKFHQGKGNGDYVVFFSGDGCYSHVGRGGGVQGVSIGDGCQAVGIAAHEIAHAWGFWHEQNRFDRDKYIEIEYQNIDPEVYSNFMAIPTDLMDDVGVAYDLGSVMHYSSLAFSTSKNLISIRTLDPNYQTTPGQRQRLSFIDVKQMNKAYCSGVCKNQLACQHAGYADPSGDGKNCNRCRCPLGFGGTLCEKTDQSDAGCGGVLKATSNWQNIQTSSPLRQCSWLLQADEGNHVILEVINVNVLCRPTCRGFLEVKKGPDFGQTGYRFCCNNTWTNPIISTGNEISAVLRGEPTKAGNWAVQFRFRSDASASKDENKKANSTWTAWSAWSACSVSCGGCGFRERTRTCPSGSCGSGNASERAPCGEQLCKASVAMVIDSMCQRQEPVPCNARRKRARDWHDLRTRQRRQESNCGNRPVTFMCSRTNPHYLRPLTADEMRTGVLSSGWNRSPNQAAPGNACCTGFRASGATCVKQGRH